MTLRQTPTADGGVIETSLVLPVALDRVFAFFADAGNLEAITPPELRFRTLTPLPIAMRAGAEIDYRLRLWGVPLGWRTLISRWEPPTMFVDVQLRGPYRSWVHTHRFADLHHGRTLITDEVRYALPWPPLGRIGRPVVARQLTRIFSYRQRRVRSLLVPRQQAWGRSFPRLPLSDIFGAPPTDNSRVAPTPVKCHPEPPA